MNISAVSSDDHHRRARRLYTLICFSSALLMFAVFTVETLYQIKAARLDPFQIVLVGTILELSIFLFEVPTGVLADRKSRRLSVIVGYFLIGCGFILEGSIPRFWAIALAQVVWGTGITFTSGATQAWIADELPAGEDMTAIFLRGSRAEQLGGVAGVPLGMLCALRAVSLPLVAGGGLLIVLSLYLLLRMPERGYLPEPADKGTGFPALTGMWTKIRELVRRRPLLMLILLLGFFYGLYGEGFDRLWTPHLLTRFPAFAALAGKHGDIVLIGTLWFFMQLVSFLIIELVRRLHVSERSHHLQTWLTGIAGIELCCLIYFSISFQPWLAVLAFWLIMGLRNLTLPLYQAWLNRQIDDSRVRATFFSISSQVDAIGQISGGPGIGLIGKRISIGAALFSSSMLFVPVVVLYLLLAARRHRKNSNS
jgi:DHA3 family tetracycline resistance protein-like MFS transporter